ncbi:polysaccharide deacetylase family protein [Ollibium composti]|uniref:Polysaccharide deacetylase n=1 Tax=Ollibium composti TaxID=2675109 RepID=A0ABY2QDC8_9HYPH|nr:polysaccharide deacetylase family protein [Mesorhizobium composti]THF58981.1 polysaccharide deacetylase [Mesorhizobium composti]
MFPAKSVAFRVAVTFSACLAASAAFADPPSAWKPARPKQAVIISFDSARDISQWQRSRALAKRTGAHFTYFLSCVFLLTPETRKAYAGPHKGAGKSNVGFAASKDEVAARLEQIRLAATEGHDIGSHGCGHFDGKAWTKTDWRTEFSAFRHVLENAYALNGIAPEPPDWRAFADHAVTGFRAPYLSTGKAMYAALAEAGFRYDASGVSGGPVEPQASGGILHFSLPLIPEGPKGRPVIAMDYNLYARHSGAVEKPEEKGAFEERAYQAFHAAFEREYDGERVPLQLGFHFTLMNGGAYWDALERFADEVCVKADVECISFRDWTERHPPAATPAHAQPEGKNS